MKTEDNDQKRAELEDGEITGMDAFALNLLPIRLLRDVLHYSEGEREDDQDG